MPTLIEQAMAALQSLPDDRRDELAQVIIDVSTPTIQYGEEQLAGIETAIEDVKADRFADPALVEATLAKLHQV